MRHKKAGKQLSRNTSHRRALLRNIVTSLFKHEQIETTDAKAKSLRPIAEKMITLAKRGDLHARRQALSYLQDKAVTHKLFDELKDRFLDRQGGYVRIVKKGVRKGDAAPISIVQLVPEVEEKKADKKKAKKSKKSKSAVPKTEKKVAVKKKDEAPEKVQDAEPPDTTDEIATEIKEETAVAEEVQGETPPEEIESQEEDSESSENEGDKQA
ncbi:MAG: 50S ribosomal protein L17 [Deltaproteobacteria bacterium]|nr:50S ribosomal protein L17 [Deltaproteobacteria bacterium]